MRRPLAGPSQGRLSERLSVARRVYQFSKRSALEDSRQQLVVSMGARGRLEAQRLIIAEKLKSLGSRDPPPVCLDDDRVSVSSVTVSLSALLGHTKAMKQLTCLLLCIQLVMG